ncbi:flagellar basal-body rod protein FlgG [Thiogranum longum]|uniref:Flagellar basal-body rod protein FlgG n=1 Tax=Thiogranum longum TaxID=1537524 RepID=A0A4V2PH11_9GAMM|nr:flagellar basal-body rod protein FlgG [Thiogranum longum]TCK18866.1 flagellar basal-body rod protein FlgG [Thiogranum longum]
MNKALWVAKTGLEAQQTRMSVISNNLANVNTTGFKRDRAMFEDMLYQNVRQVGALSSQNSRLPTGLQIGTGVRTVATEKIHTLGNIVQTSNSLDVAIQGRGFFQILQPDGNIAYSRDGSFKLDETGQLVNSSGLVLQPAITIPGNATSVTVGSDGVVSALTPGSATPTQLGSIQLADFINPTGLQAAGQNLFLETASSGSPTTGTPGLNGIGSVVQGALETSNVNVVEELVNMIETQRAYEMNSKAIQTTDSMLQYVTNNL